MDGFKNKDLEWMGLKTSNIFLLSVCFELELFSKSFLNDFF